MLPEEAELVRLEADQEKLKEQVASAELALETLKIETAIFQRRYYQAVGKLYVELDELAANLANLKFKRTPGDPTLREQAKTAEQQAKRSAEEIGSIDAQPAPTHIVSGKLKEVYRKAVKLMHPDLAMTERERERRTRVMASVNFAYEKGDQKEIERLIDQFGQDPEAIEGDDIGSRLVKVIRRIAQLRQRLLDIEREIEAHKNTDIYKLRQTIEVAEAEGGNPLGDMAGRLRQDISRHKEALKAA
jgi:hypothetical protein